MLTIFIRLTFRLLRLLQSLESQDISVIYPPKRLNQATGLFRETNKPKDNIKRPHESYLDLRRVDARPPPLRYK